MKVESYLIMKMYGLFHRILQQNFKKIIYFFMNVHSTQKYIKTEQLKIANY